MSKYQRCTNRFQSARNTVFIVSMFTLLNVWLQVSNAGIYFLFSATIPYSIVDFMRFYCGLYPAEFYDASWEGVEFLPESAFYVAVAIAVAIVGLYILCFFLSKKDRIGWLIVALTMFTADTISMFVLYPINSSMVVDILFHAYVMAILISGVVAYYQRKKLPSEESPCGASEENGDSGNEEAKNYAFVDSPILRVADMSVKNRILAEAELYGHKVVYRRVKKTNELVIDGKVYGEYTARVERSHILTAHVGGHAFAAGLGLGGSYSYIAIDGCEAVRKVRFI